MIIGCRAIIQLGDDAVILALISVLQIKRAPGVVIVTRRTRCVSNAVDDASGFGLHDDGIDLGTGPQVNGGSSEVVCRRQPV